VKRILVVQKEFFTTRQENAREPVRGWMNNVSRRRPNESISLEKQLQAADTEFHGGRKYFRIKTPCNSVYSVVKILQNLCYNAIMEPTSKRNRLTFGLGTIGRDMVYSLVSMYLIFYLTDVIKLPTGSMWWVAGIILIARIYDALNDPVMGFIVDNTHTRWGKFKPWIAIGMVLSAVFTVLLFTDFGLENGAFVGAFAVFYLMWGMSFTANDISY
jgi:hypothetical protein